MSGSPWTSSIQLHRDFLNSKAICPMEEVLISACCCGCNLKEQQRNDSIHVGGTGGTGAATGGDDTEEDRTCVMMILEAFPYCLNSDETSLLPSLLSSNRLETMCCPRARMHPFLEEFLLCATAVSSKYKDPYNGDVVVEEEEEEDKHAGGMRVTPQEKDDNDPYYNHSFLNHHVFVQVADPNYDDDDDDDYDDCDDHHGVIINQRYFHVDKIDAGKICNVQDLLLNRNHDVGQYQIHISLQYICSTRENYDTEIMSCLFQECRRDMDNGGVDDDDKNLQGIERRRKEKLLSLLKKSLEHRTMKKGCFLAFNMMSMGSSMDGKDWDHDSDVSSSSSSSFWNDNYDGNDNGDDDDFIIMCRVCDLTVSFISKDAGHPILVHSMNHDQYYRLGSCNSGGGDHCSVHIHAMMSSEKDGGEEHKTAAIVNQSNVIQQNIITTCPGYESLVDEIVTLANISIRGGSPTGVAIVGCAGVGKTRLAMAVSNLLMSNGLPGVGHTVMVVSCMDILLEASSWMDLEHLKKFIFKHVFRCKSSGRLILVIDDLDAIFDSNDGDDNDDFLYDGEKGFARHAVLGVMDEIIKKNNGHGPMPLILGLSSRDAMRQSSDLAKMGRFEKFITMSPPTESQRIEILKNMFQTLPIDCNDATSKQTLCETWSTIIARNTSGCVAADLKRMCVYAVTKSKARVTTNKMNAAKIQWSDIREAARDCVPSQLSNLDVTLARNIDDGFMECTQEIPRDSFFRMWDKKFAGYNELKAKIYRTIIWPWKRQQAFLNGTLNRTKTDLERDVPPPTGVLFHGPSGTGKTFAAECLAGSLGLNVIRVRATDILDQWLGGSEAAIRALFARARSAAPCALFFDDLDAIAANRESDGDSNDVYARLLSTLLNEIDGISGTNTLSGILIVGTTNRMQAIDAALLRPGRFEEHLLLDLPSTDDITEMLQMFLEKVPMDSKVHVHDIAELLNELNACAADVKGLCSEACLNAIGKVDDSMDVSKIVLEVTDFDQVINRWK